MRKKFLIIFLIIIFIVGAKVGSSIVSFSPVLLQLLFNKNIELKTTGDAINVLILGISGGSHDGPDLTDTIIFASIDQAKNKTTLISLPRDLWVSELSQKVNTAYTIGESKRKGGGITLSKTVVAKMLNRPINYVVVINFDGFVKAVDLIGGLTITVDNTLDDKNYPIDGKEQETCGHVPDEIKTFTVTVSAETQLWDFFPCRYTYLHFDRGQQHMDGKTALEFVRSRHAEGYEGTDFGRSKRQEKVIAAFKEKTFSAQTFLNPLKLVSLYSTISENIDTDIKQNEIDDFVRLAQKMKGTKMQSIVLDYGDEQTKRVGLLKHPDITSEYDNQWVLIPRIGNGNFLEIQNYITCVLTKDTNSCPIK